MPRKPSNQPNDVELSILRVLWDRGPSSVRDVHESLQESRDAGYTSTLKMMQVMCEKGLLKRDETRRPQVYRPAVPQEQTQRQILRDVIGRVFGGSVGNLVMRAVESHRITPEESADIRKLLKDLEGGRQ